MELLDLLEGMKPNFKNEQKLSEYAVLSDPEDNRIDDIFKAVDVIDTLKAKFQEAIYDDENIEKLRTELRIVVEKGPGKDFEMKSSLNFSSVKKQMSSLNNLRPQGKAPLGKEEDGSDPKSEEKIKRELVDSELVNPGRNSKNERFEIEGNKDGESGRFGVGAEADRLDSGHVVRLSQYAQPESNHMSGNHQSRRNLASSGTQRVEDAAMIMRGRDLGEQSSREQTTLLKDRDNIKTINNRNIHQIRSNSSFHSREMRSGNKENPRILRLPLPGQIKMFQPVPPKAEISQFSSTSYNPYGRSTPLEVPERTEDPYKHNFRYPYPPKSSQNRIPFPNQSRRSGYLERHIMLQKQVRNDFPSEGVIPGQPNHSESILKPSSLIPSKGIYRGSEEPPNPSGMVDETSIIDLRSIEEQFDYLKEYKLVRELEEERTSRLEQSLKNADNRSKRIAWLIEKRRILDKEAKGMGGGGTDPKVLRAWNRLFLKDKAVRSGSMEIIVEDKLRRMLCSSVMRIGGIRKGDKDNRGKA